MTRARSRPLPRDRAFRAADPIPFEHVWAPLLRDARRAAGRGACARFDEAAQGALVPGLLRGVAGTGYTLLRVLSPGNLPSALVAAVPAATNDSSERSRERISTGRRRVAAPAVPADPLGIVRAASDVPTALA